MLQYVREDFKKISPVPDNVRWGNIPLPSPSVGPLCLFCLFFYVFSKAPPAHQGRVQDFSMGEGTDIWAKNVKKWVPGGGHGAAPSPHPATHKNSRIK